MATANFNDMSVLATDTVFGNRVLMALVQFCTTVIPSESISSTAVQLHVVRKNFASQILNNPSFYKPLFVNAVAANQIVANDATASATLVGSSTIPAQALLCTDGDISNAVAAAFNAFVAQI